MPFPPELTKELNYYFSEISMPPQAADVLTLEDLGLESDRISSIIYFLRIEYNLFFEPEQIPLLTIET